MSENRISIPVNLEIDLKTSQVALNGFPISLQKAGYDSLKDLITARLTDSIAPYMREPAAKKQPRATGKKPQSSERGKLVTDETRKQVGERMTRWWAERKASGLCIRCDARAEKNYSFCKNHLKDQRSFAAKARRLGSKSWSNTSKAK